MFIYTKRVSRFYKNTQLNYYYNQQQTQTFFEEPESDAFI